MGMELYNSSPAAKAVWDAADRHLLNTYVRLALWPCLLIRACLDPRSPSQGFSIISIVKNNPKELTVYFGGLRGQAIRSRYMAMESEDEHGNRVALFPEVVSALPCSSSFVFSAAPSLTSLVPFCSTP